MTTWLTAAGPITGDGDVTNETGITRRQIINTAQISNTGLAFVRVTFESAAGQAWTISNAYIGHAASSGDVYDFESTPTELLFSGASGFAIALGTQKVSDQTTFTIQASKNLIISYYTSGDASHDDIRIKATQTGWTNYLKAANDPSTVNATGYTLASNAVLGVMKVEVGSLGSNFFPFF